MQDEHSQHVVHQPIYEDTPADHKGADTILVVAGLLFLGWYFGAEINAVVEWIAWIMAKFG